MLPHLKDALVAKGTFPKTTIKLGGEGAAFVVEGWPRGLHLSLLGRGGGEKRRLSRVWDLEQNC